MPGLYDPTYEHDACGVAFVARLGAPGSHEVIYACLVALEQLEHRGGEGADPDTGDGSGSSSDPAASCARRPASSCRTPAATGSAMCFLPRTPQPRGRAEAADRARPCEAEGQRRPGLARGADRRRAPAAWAPGERAAHRPALRGRRGRRGRPRRPRAPALRDPARGGARAAGRPVDRELLLAHPRLQGNAHRAAALALLPGPARPALREPARGRPLPLLHEHLPELGARPPVPDARPQRRDQHAARQPQLDARAREGLSSQLFGDDIQKIKPLLRDDISDSASLDGAARAARARRPLDRPRDLDADAAGLPGAARAAPGGARLLRLPRGARGAVGRPGGGGLQRRPRRGRDAGPQRPAAGTLAHDPRRLGGARLGDRRVQDQRRPGERQGPPAARASCSWSTSRRTAIVPDDEIKRDLARAGPTASGSATAWCTSRTCRSAARGAARGAAAGPPARLRLVGGGPARDPRPDGARRRRAHRLDGQRPRPGRDVGRAALALLVLQAALRPGHEPGRSTRSASRW